MDLTQLANLGEFIGGVAVLVTLVYLALQVRQGANVARTQVHQESSRMSSELLMQSDRDVLDLFARASTDPDSISASDGRFLRVQFVATTNYYETLFYARERGEVDDDLWESRCHRIAGFVNPQRELLWPQVKNGHGKRFRDFVDRLLAETDTKTRWLLSEPPP